MDKPVQLNRRTFLTHMGKGAVAVAILGPTVLACSDSGSDTAASSTASTGTTSTGPAATDAPGTSSATTVPPATTTSPPEQTTTTAEPADAAGRWERVELGGVSAYVLARAGRAAVVDTGRSGSESSIEEVLIALDLGWDAVDHVVLTHLHGDHIGSLGPVMAAATSAAAYAGAADIGAMGASPRPVGTVGDGDSVFGLNIIETPGHTAGHICVHDPLGGVLVAGDALNGSNGGVAGANPSFTPDMAAANESVKKLATLQFDIAFFGHGEPVVGSADMQVADLAATL